MSKYNNGTCISFQTIKENRDIAVKEIAEGHKGLELLLNTCIDADLETRSCCADDGFLMFELNDKTIGKLANIFNYFEKNNMESLLSVGGSKDGSRTVTLYFDSYEQCSLLSEVIKNSNSDGFNLTLSCLDAIIARFNEYEMDIYFSCDKLLYYGDVANFNSSIVEEHPEVSEYILKLKDLQINDGRTHALYLFGDKDSIVGLTYALYSDEKEENNKKGLLGKLKNLINNQSSVV